MCDCDDPTHADQGHRCRADGDLNDVETFKREDDALNVRQRILDVYSKEGFDSIAPNDLNGRFRWMGLYTQRKPGLDGTHTGEDDIGNSRFMMRVRTDGGKLTTAQVRVIDVYSKQGFDSIPSEDLAPRFKWIGLYTQRKQDLGGEHTGVKTNAELQDKYFMLRIRLDGGQTSTAGIRAIGEISRDFARDTADFSDRQNVQLHNVQIEDVPTIRERLDAVGLITTEACGDCPAG